MFALPTSFCVCFQSCLPPLVVLFAFRPFLLSSRVVTCRPLLFLVAACLFVSLFLLPSPFSLSPSLSYLPLAPFFLSLSPNFCERKDRMMAAERRIALVRSSDKPSERDKKARKRRTSTRMKFIEFLVLHKQIRLDPDVTLVFLFM